MVTLSHLYYHLPSENLMLWCELHAKVVYWFDQTTKYEQKYEQQWCLPYFGM